MVVAMVVVVVAMVAVAVAVAADTAAAPTITTTTTMTHTVVQPLPGEDDGSHTRSLIIVEVFLAGSLGLRA